MLNYIFRICIVFMLLLLSDAVLGQSEKPAEFQALLNEALNERPSDYKTLNSYFDKFEADSTRMKTLRGAFNNANYSAGESYALNCLGVLFRNISHYNKSIRFHRNALDVAREADNTEFIVSSLNNIGVCYRRMDDIKPALDYHFEALELATKIEAPSENVRYNIAVSQNSLGNIYLVLDQNKLAIEYFKKSLVIEKELGNRLGLAINFQNIGHAYESMGNLELALSNYRRSLDYNEQIGSEIGRIICYNSIGQVLLKQDKLDDAEYIIKNALDKALIADDKFYTSLSYNNLGWAQTLLKDYKQAENNLNEGLKISQEFNLKSSEVASHERLSDLYTETEQFGKALNHYKNSIEIGRTINNERNLKYVNDIIVQFENEAKTRQIESLAADNEEVRERLKRNQIIFWLALLSLFTTTIVLLIVSKNRRLNQDKLILTLEQDMLRNQMNPHFIFNSLNSIKLYIINNEKENAVYYLNKFSKLIRKILVASSEKIISLKEELETMQLYMNIENIRFSNEIEFIVNVDNVVKTNSIMVPPLILQPFLENALWHGLSTIEYDKKITLDVFQEVSNFVTITITDNGIGRKESAKINDGKTLKRKSLGLNITKARLRNFSESYTEDFKMNIEDLIDADNQPLGTRVVLKLPTQTNVLKTA